MNHLQERSRELVEKSRRARNLLPGPIRRYATETTQVYPGRWRRADAPAAEQQGRPRGE